MALLTDDQDIRDVRMWMDYGGNGDYYINLLEVNKKILSESGNIEKHTVVTCSRIAMSGGNAPTEVKLAVAALYRAMEAAGINKHPKEEQ